MPWWQQHGERMVLAFCFTASGTQQYVTEAAEREQV